MLTRVTCLVSVHPSSGGSDSDTLHTPGVPEKMQSRPHDTCLIGGETKAASSMCLLRAEYLFLGGEKLGWTSNR